MLELVKRTKPKDVLSQASWGLLQEERVSLRWGSTVVPSSCSALRLVFSSHCSSLPGDGLAWTDQHRKLWFTWEVCTRSLPLNYKREWIGPPSFLPFPTSHPTPPHPIPLFFTFLCLANPALDHPRSKTLRTGDIHCFLPLLCLSKGCLSYSTLYSVLNSVMRLGNFWKCVVAHYPAPLNSGVVACKPPPFDEFVVGLDNLLKRTVQN